MGPIVALPSETRPKGDGKRKLATVIGLTTEQSHPELRMTSPGSNRARPFLLEPHVESQHMHIWSLSSVESHLKTEEKRLPIMNRSYMLETLSEYTHWQRSKLCPLDLWGLKP